MTLTPATCLQIPGDQSILEAAQTRLSNITEDDGELEGAQLTRDRDILKVSDIRMSILVVL